MPSTDTVCGYEGCSRTDILAKGLCKTHYHRVREQTLRASKPPRVLAKDQPCAFEGCEKLVGNGGARGYCSTHARAFYKGTLGKVREDKTVVAECPICHQTKRLDRNHPSTRQRVCQTCYRGRKPGGERQKPGPKPKTTYAERPSCPQGHAYEAGSFKTDDHGRRMCLVCLEGRRKTHCPQGHPYDEDNTYVDSRGGRHCRTCQRQLMRDRRPATGVGTGGVNAAKTHCPQGHEYSVQNTRWSTDGKRRFCKVCARLNGVKQNLKRFSLSEDQFEARLAQQNGRCPVCSKELAETGIHIDHDHGCCTGSFSCGKCVRGLLCADCNHLLGCAHDDPAILRGAVEYLERYAQGHDHR